MSGTAARLAASVSARAAVVSKYVSVFDTVIIFFLTQYAQRVATALTSFGDDAPSNTIVAVLAGVCTVLIMAVSLVVASSRWATPWVSYLMKGWVAPGIDNFFTLGLGIATAAAGRASDALSLDGSVSSQLVSMVVVVVITTTARKIVAPDKAENTSDELTEVVTK